MNDPPDPFQDWEGYCLYQEMTACVECNGIGEDCEDCEEWVRHRCDGSGIDPDFEVSEEDDDHEQ